MFKSTIGYLSVFIIGLATLALVLGAMLAGAATATGATSNYNVTVSWASALTSVIWPPTRLPFLPFLGIAVLAGFTTFTFFRVPRFVGVAFLIMQSCIGFFAGGGLGLFFIVREFARYHFSMDGEKLGENWFTYESVAVWTLAAALLAVLKLFVGNRPPEGKALGQPALA